MKINSHFIVFLFFIFVFTTKSTIYSQENRNAQETSSEEDKSNENYNYENNYENYGNRNANSENNVNSGNTYFNWYDDQPDQKANLDEVFEERFVKTVTIDQLPLMHPKGSSQMSLKMLIFQTGIRDFSQFKQCGRDLDLWRSSAANPRSMLSLSAQLTQQIGTATSRYHWCFYYWIFDLNQKLESDQLSRSYLLTRETLLGRMRSLWVLARALDEYLGEKQYFPYLRGSYMDLSRRYLGRELETFGQSFGQDE